MTDADKKLYDKAVDDLLSIASGTPEEIDAMTTPWIAGYQAGLKARINATTISDCPVKDEWHYPSKGELPEKDNCRCIGYFGNDDYEICKVKRGRFWISSCGWLDFEDATAWRYIEPPKEEE